MISANVCFSWKSNSDTPCNNSARSAKVVRRYLLNACSARLNRFSISASLKGENSFSFSPLAGLMEANGIALSYIAIAINGGTNSCELAVAELRPPRHPRLQPQSFRHQNVIEHITRPLHEQREHSSDNRYSQHRRLVVQVKRDYDRC